MMYSHEMLTPPSPLDINLNSCYTFESVVLRSYYTIELYTCHFSFKTDKIYSVYDIS